MHVLRNMGTHAQILLEHLASGVQPLAAESSVVTLAGTSLSLTADGAEPVDITQGGVTVTAPAGGTTASIVEITECSDFVVYVVDGVLVSGDVQLPEACGLEGQAPCRDGCADGFEERAGTCHRSG